MKTDKGPDLTDLGELTRLIEDQLLLDAAAAAEIELAVRKWYVRSSQAVPDLWQSRYSPGVG